MYFTEAPIIRCSGCQRQFEDPCASEYDEDSEITCPNCDARLRCDQAYTVRSWRWSLAQ